MPTARLPETYPSDRPRYEYEATVVAHHRPEGQEAEIVFYAPSVAQAAQPGQFLELLFGENYAPLARRPFSVYRVDRAAGTVSVLYIARGSFTSGLARKQVGDAVSLLGPLGAPFAWTFTPETRYILMAGGRGAPPITFLARELARDLIERGGELAQLYVLNAARSAIHLVGTADFLALGLQHAAITEDGSQGRKGVVTEILRESLERWAGEPIQLFACGPMPMLRAIADIALEADLPCQLSIETSMPCGIGTCRGCAVPVRDASSPDGLAYALACWEGPVFEAQELVWEAL